MTNTKDINSTERLLNVIRGSQQPSSEEMGVIKGISPKQKNSNKSSVIFPRVFKGKHSVNVGVDIGQDDISFAKMTKTSDGRQLLVDKKIVPFSDKITKGSDEFYNLLKTSLTAFVGSYDDCDIWAMVNTTEVNVHHLKIPIVPKKQLKNVIYWTAKKESPIDEQNVVFDYEVQGEITDQGIPKYSVMVYTAPRVEVESIREMFSSIGVRLTGITIAPFAIQNIFRTKWITVGETTFASLYIGHDYSRIDIFNKTNLVMTRGIKTGISSMMEAIYEFIAESAPNKKVNRDHVKKIINDLSVDPGKSLKDEDGIQWTEKTILDMITPALERLTRQIERTLEYYATSVGYEKVEKIFVSSVLNVFHHPLLHYISEQLGTKSECFDPYKGKNVSAPGASLSLAEKAALVPVIGLALSDRKQTPNTIFTYVEKEKAQSRKRINRGIFATFALALIVCSVILLIQGIETRNLSVQRGKLEKELSLFNPLLSKEKVTSLAEDLKSRHQMNQQYSKRYKGMALISELSLVTPENIRLINVHMSIPVAGVQVQKKDAAQKEKDEGVIIEGVVLGDRNALDTLLAQYVMKLENSIILQGVSLQKSNIVNFRKKEILQFTIKAKIGS